MAVRRRRVVRRRRRNPNPNPNPRRRRRAAIPLPRLLYPASYNPRRRRKTKRRRAVSSYRRRRRNPPSMKQVGTSLLPNLGWAVAGFSVTKMVGNVVTPMLTGFGLTTAPGTQPLVRIGTKLGIAYLGAWLLGFGFGRRVFVPAFVGGSLEVIQDIAATYIAPYFPTLGNYQEPLQVYYERQAQINNGMGDYYQPQAIQEVIP